MEDLKKLPKWAQERIQVAEMRRDEAEAKVAELFRGEDTDIFMLDGLSAQYPLLRRATIRFWVNASQHIEVRRQADGSLFVSGTRRVRIRPQAANCFEVEVEP